MPTAAVGTAAGDMGASETMSGGFQDARSLSIGMVLFPGVTHLDLSGPYEVFVHLPRTAIHLVAETADPVGSEGGMRLLPDATFRHAPPFDIVVVPGGPGVNGMMESEPLLDFLRVQARSADYVTSVCTGALILGAAGLLHGYRATTHWLSLNLLPLFGAVPTEGRVVIDRNRITGGGVTAGIDFGLTLAHHLRGEQTAREIQLIMQYEPAPPFRSGSPTTASPQTVDAVTETRSSLQADRRRIAERAAARLRSRSLLPTETA